MTRQEIIELSNQLTERKGERNLNLQSLFTFVLQDICKRQRFWWRRVMATFNLTAGMKEYDLSALLSEIAFEEIIKIELVTSPDRTELAPIFDSDSVIQMTLATTRVVPSRYTIKPGESQRILFDPADANYGGYIVGWGMPNPATDTATQAVPLIPSWGHNTIVAGMMAKIFKYAYGSKNDKTVDAQMEYEQGLVDLMSKKQFDPNYRLQLSVAEDAIRST